MNRINKNKDNCCGCSACMSICPKHAISMQEDCLGFKYPLVDDTLCIDCGLCEKVCQFKTDYVIPELAGHPLGIYAFRNKDIQQLERSQSGAAFWTLANSFIHAGGVVYGVGYKQFEAIHKRTETVEGLEEMRGSKYVQSDVDATFKMTLEDLKQGRSVLYSGTPCQIAGLRSYIPEKYREKLFTIDLICHGVPGPKVWKDYLSELQKKFRDPLTRVNFRDKSKGWNVNVPSFGFGDTIRYEMDYARIFYSNLVMREACFKCPYTNFKRVADITLADFWGWYKISEEFHDNKGVSLVLVNSTKGQQLFESVQDQIEYRESDVQSCMQRNLQRPSSRPLKRSQVENDYQQYGFHYVSIHHFGMSRKARTIRVLKSIAKKIIRK